MERLQRREHEIFATLKYLHGEQFVLIGGYAVNTYTLPRFSTDCDIVVNDESALKNIEQKLLQLHYKKADAPPASLPYHGGFVRYEKGIEKNMQVSIDILYKEVLDRQTGARMTGDWVVKHAGLRTLKGKTITEDVQLRIVNPDALVVMKFVSCRNTDIRDIFMILPQVADKTWVKKEVNILCNFHERFERVMGEISSPHFRNNLQGVYGYVDEKTFEKHKEALLRMK